MVKAFIVFYDHEHEDNLFIVIPSFIERNMLKSMSPNFG